MSNIRIFYFASLILAAVAAVAVWGARDKPKVHPQLAFGVGTAPKSYAEIAGGIGTQSGTATPSMYGTITSCACCVSSNTVTTTSVSRAQNYGVMTCFGPQYQLLIYWGGDNGFMTK